MPMLTLGLQFHGDTGDFIWNFGTFCFVSERCTCSRILLNIEGKRNACLQLNTWKGNNMFVDLLSSKNCVYIQEIIQHIITDLFYIPYCLFAQTHTHAPILNPIVCMLLSISKASERCTLRCIVAIRGVFVYLFLCDCVLKTCPESWSKHSSSSLCSIFVLVRHLDSSFPPFVAAPLDSGSNQTRILRQDEDLPPRHCGWWRCCGW